MAQDDIQGQVVDAQGNPVSGAIVELTKSYQSSPTGQEAVQRTTTDSNGNYIFTGHPDGDGTTQEWHVSCYNHDGTAYVNSFNNPGVTADLPTAIPDSELTQIADHIWNMDEGSGGTIADSVGSADGTLNGPVWTTGQGGAGDAYLTFDAVDDITTHGAVFDSNDTEFTVCVWAYPTTSGGYVVQQDIVDGFIIWIAENGEWLPSVNGDVGGNGGLAPASLNTWSMLAITYASGTANRYLYEAGSGQVASDSYTTTDPSFPGNDEFTFGNRPAGDRPWGDDIDYGIVAFSEASESQITDHYNETVGLYQ